MIYHEERREFFKFFCFSLIFIIIGAIFVEVARAL